MVKVASTFRHYVQGASVNTGYLPRQEDPLTFDGGNHKYLKLNLNRFKTTYIDPQNVAGGVSAGGGSTILGAGIHGMYTVQVYPNYNIGSLPDVSIEETLHDPSAPNYSNTADCTNSGKLNVMCYSLVEEEPEDVLYNYVGQIGSHQNRPDISSGSGAGGGVLIGYNVPIPRVYGWQTFI